ncbi:hypothetical protein [Paenibacillus xerothermodurans]|uniref:Uncharacterized protein n=1 Tax=Paenibacillus xerothermodurans TaxID=1977292 RepID=A0A2W1NA18_PAEXE|nr:hypothetical protein [Paenibacillus xerothermodurans]PZE20001.1 hypothetical protein CBW46_015040 [Paenibacillus xerothermodurans]
MGGNLGKGIALILLANNLFLHVKSYLVMLLHKVGDHAKGPTAFRQWTVELVDGDLPSFFQSNNGSGEAAMTVSKLVTLSTVGTTPGSVLIGNAYIYNRKRENRSSPDMGIERRHLTAFVTGSNHQKKPRTWPDRRLLLSIGSRKET